MPNLKVLDMAGKEVGDISLSDEVFGIEPNAAVLHAAVRAYLMNQRQGTHSTLTRTEVSGGGKKPWRQKGTGRARQGSTRAPQWTHGGIVHGPKPRSYRVTLNKKVRRLALRSALSTKVAGGEMVVIDAIKTDDYKTKTMAAMLRAVGADKKTLVVLSEVDEKVVASLRNIEGVKVAIPGTLNTYDVLNCDKFVVAQAAARKIEEVYAQ
jgi:large subunit ribosomal protein L4